MPAFVVVGATSWGVTLAGVLSPNHELVVLVARNPAEAELVRARRGIVRLPEVLLSGRVEVVSDPPPPGDVAGIVFAVPAQSLRASALRFRQHRGVSVLSAAKGIELTTGLRMSEVLA